MSFAQSRDRLLLPQVRHGDLVQRGEVGELGEGVGHALGGAQAYMSYMRWLPWLNELNRFNL